MPLQELYEIKFPVFALEFFRYYQGKDKNTANFVSVAGGGGPSKSGVKNAFVIFRAPNESTLLTNTAKKLSLDDAGFEYEFEHSLGQQSGAIMCMAHYTLPEDDQVVLVCGVDRQVVIFKLDMEAQSAAEVLRFDVCSSNSKEAADVYVKLVRVVEGRLLTVGTDNSVSVWSLDGLADGKKPKAVSERVTEQEIVDADLLKEEDERLLLYATSSALTLIPETKNDDDDEQALTFDISKTGLPPSRIRFCRVISTEGKSQIAALSLSKSTRQSHLSLLDAKLKLIRFKLIHQKPITTIETSQDGRHLGFGAADGCVGCVSLPAMSIRFSEHEAHSFTVTATAFQRSQSEKDADEETPGGGLLISASADYSVRVFPLHRYQGAGRRLSVVYVLLFLFIIILAQKYYHLLNASKTGSAVTKDEL